MKIIMEESQRLTLMRERMTSKTTAADDADISLTGLPDLSLPLVELEKSQQPSKPKLTQPSSSRDTTISLTPKSVKPRLSRSLSQRSQIEATSVSSILPAGEEHTPSQRDRPTILSAADDAPWERTSALVVPEATSDDNNNGVKPWQASLKKMLASGQQPELTAAGMASTPPLTAMRTPKTLVSLPLDVAAAGSRPSSNNAYVDPALRSCLCCRNASDALADLAGTDSKLLSS